MSIGIIIAIVIVVLIVLWAISAYNGLVALRNRVKNAWSQIDVQLKQRADLIPNLVETVKGYASHESEVFTQVTQARAKAVQTAADPNAAPAERIQAENALSLQGQLKALEEKLAYARQFYNDVVQKYNTRIETVPTNIIASLFHFKQADHYQIAESDRAVPQVKF